MAQCHLTEVYGEAGARGHSYGFLRVTVRLGYGLLQKGKGQANVWM